MRIEYDGTNFVGWQSQKNGDSVQDNIEKVLKNMSINPKTFFLRATSQNNKDLLKKKTSEAYALGIFGAPTFLVNKKVFWGQDRLGFAVNESMK